VLGLSALILPLAIEMRTLRSELPVMAGAAILLWVLSANGVLSRIDGVVVVIGAIAYTCAVIWAARRETQAAAAEFADAYPADGAQTSSGHRTVLHVGMMLGGIAVVVLGAQWLVDAAVGMARAFSVSDALIGLTVVALGTTAPELVTTVVSTLRGERDIAIGNLLGSSIYNILLILGVTCLVPAHGLELTPALARIDIPIMVAATLVCIPIFISGRRVGRIEGAAMLPRTWLSWPSCLRRKHDRATTGVAFAYEHRGRGGHRGAGGHRPDRDRPVAPQHCWLAHAGVSAQFERHPSDPRGHSR
jgi:cation:H+ antiporter